MSIYDRLSRAVAHRFSAIFKHIIVFRMIIALGERKGNCTAEQRLCVISLSESGEREWGRAAPARHHKHFEHWTSLYFYGWLYCTAVRVGVVPRCV